MGVATWELDAVNTECVDNASCSPYLETCSGDEYTLEQQNGCVCFALPDPLPEPCCDPTCGSTTTTTTSTTTSTSTTTTTSTTTSTSTTTTTTTSTTTTAPACQSYTDSDSGQINPASPPVELTYTLPADSCAGAVEYSISPSGQGSACGVIVCVTIDGGAPSCSGCITTGGGSVVIPAGTTTVTVTLTGGCSNPTGNPEDYSVHVSG